MKCIILITGTPGVGKTTLSKRLLPKLKGAILYDANSIAKKNSLYIGKDKFGSKIVNLEKLERAVGKIAISHKSGILIFEGHLLCEIKIRGAIAITLREHLPAMKKRLVARGYPIEKIRDNLVSEAIDYCGFASQKNYDVSYELFSKSALPKIISIAKGKKIRAPAINLLPELVEIIKRDKELAI